MNKYCIAYISFFDNVLKQTVVAEVSKYRALYTYMYNIGYRGIDHLTTIEELVNYAWDCDTMVNVIEI